VNSVINECAFCRGGLEPAFARDTRLYARCTRCGAYLRCDERFGSTGEYESGSFAECIDRTLRHQPAFEQFDEYSPLLREGNLLEVGCGSGHFLAAAKARGRDVAGVEISTFHRAYIRRRWGIDAISETLEAEDIKRFSFDNIVSFNFLEHLPDPLEHLNSIRQMLKPTGRCIISTANGGCSVSRILGRWWAMFKPADHISIPTAESLRRAGLIAGLRAVRVWSSEYPLETPIGIAVAIRDRIASGRKRTDPRDLAVKMGTDRPKRVDRLMRAPQFRFVASTFSRWMLGATIKVIYEKDPTLSALPKSCPE
jgi:SAM-dependent methyltransferase